MTGSTDRVEFDGAGYHTAKVDNAAPIILDCLEEAIAATKDRIEADPSYAQILTNDERTSFSVSLGNDEAKREFSKVCDELAEQHDDLDDEFRTIRELTIDKINEQRQADGLSAASGDKTDGGSR